MSDDPLVRSNLDNSQKAFCLEPARGVRMLAPAGSGKTYSLLFRCLSKFQTTEDGNLRFMVFTFTRSAGDELRDRLKRDHQFEPIRPFVDVSTLNSWGFRWLKSRMQNARLITSSKDRDFTMLNLLQPVWKKYDRVGAILSDSRRKYRAARQIMDMMDQFKSMGFRHDDHGEHAQFTRHAKWLVENKMDQHFLSILKQLAELEIIGHHHQEKGSIKEVYENFFCFWRESTEAMFLSAVITLEDQKYWPFIELKKAVKERRFTTGMHRYHHILVDEFQDINVLDLNLLKIVAAQNKTDLTIVGDDDQAIYEWRFATPEFILNPDQMIAPGYKTHILEVNYRSPKNLVELSQRLIKHNKRRVDKRVRPASNWDAQIEVLSMPSLEESVNYVASIVPSMLQDKTIRNVAIVSRKRSQIIPYQIIFAGADIPFYAAEDLHVLLSYAFDELKTMLALKAQSTVSPPFGPDPVEALLKLCDKVKHYPLNKGDKGSLKSHLLKALPRTLDQAVEALYGYRGPLKGDNKGGSMSASFYTAIQSLLTARSVSDAIYAISQSFDGLQKDYGKSLDDIFYADPPFLYLGDYARRYGDDYSAFYEDIDKAIATLAKTPPEDDEGSSDEAWKRPLHLMTALRAKGKEFDVVIVLDCNSGVWPSKLAVGEDQLEAERRLFYVAVTRTRKRLILLVDDKMFGEQVMPSPYLSEMGLTSVPA